MINNWLTKFKTAWIEHDINQVLELFTDDVEYWETPYQQVLDKAQLENEWSAIKNQRNITLDLNVFASQDNKHAVRWRLSYENDQGLQNWAGTYLLELNTNGECTYFLQVGEKQT